MISLQPIIALPERTGDPRNGGFWTPTGGWVPSVTQLLRDVGIAPAPYPSDATQTALARGRAVHEATAKVDRNPALERSIEIFEALGADVPAYTWAWMQFKAKVAIEIIDVERIVYSPTLGVAGFTDRIFRHLGLYGVLEIKTGLAPGRPPRWTRVQLSAYGKGVEETYGIGPVVLRRSVYLHDDGSFSYHDYGVETYVSDLEVVAAASVVFNWKRG